MKSPRRSPTHPHGTRGLLAACLLGGAALLGAATAHGAGTSPGLALTAASVAASGGGRVVTASGSYNFDDLVQVAFPAAGLLVIRGDRFVRYEVDGQVIEATSALVKNGVAPGELETLLQLAGAPVGPARISRLGADQVVVVLPTDFGAGPALVLLYAHHEGESFVSNTIPVVLP